MTNKKDQEQQQRDWRIRANKENQQRKDAVKPPTVKVPSKRMDGK